VRSQTRVYEIYGVEIGTWTGFSTRRGFSPAHTRLHLLVVHAGRTKCMNERAAHKSNCGRSALDAAVPPPPTHSVLQEGQTGAAWEPSQKQCSFKKWEAVDGRLLTQRM